MITGTLTLEVNISVSTEREVVELSSHICQAVKIMQGVNSCEEVDSDLDDDDGEE